MSSTSNPIHRLFGIDAAQHGDLSKTTFDKTANLEVIGLGHSRTGTTSLHEALTILGFGPCHQGVDLYRSMPRCEAFIDLYARILDGRWKAGDQALNDKLHELMQGYRSVCDMPTFPLVEEVYAAYSDAKYILSVRAGGEAAWWKSMQVLAWHLRRDWWRTLFRTLILPVYFIRRSDDCVQCIRDLWTRKYRDIGPNLYDAHNADVKKAIPKERLLVFDVREGWEPLCRFLNVDIPGVPFPNLNDSKSMEAIYTGMMVMGASTWAAYAAGAAGLAYLAFNPAFTGSLLQRLFDQAGAMTSRLGM